METPYVPSDNKLCLEDVQNERSDVPFNDQSGADNFVRGMPSNKDITEDLCGKQDCEKAVTSNSESRKLPGLPSGIIFTHRVVSMSLKVSSLSPITMVGEAHNTSILSRTENLRKRQTVKEPIDDEIKGRNGLTGELFLDILPYGATVPRTVNIVNYIGVKYSLHVL